MSYDNVFKAILFFNVVLKVQKFRGYFSELFVLLFLYHLNGDKNLSILSVLRLTEFAKRSMELGQKWRAKLKSTIILIGFL